MNQVDYEYPEAGPSKVAYPTAPIYAFDAEPKKVASTSARNLDSAVDRNFFRSARWSPDGTCILATAEDRVFRLHDTPADVEPDLAVQPRSFAQPDAIHGAVWYPTASLNHPETFCFMASIRDTPVRLIDATDGRVRATYPIVDHRERFIAPYAMAFNPDASRVYCGCENAIEVLDIATPGPGGGERIKTSSAKRDQGGQKGIISALAFSTDYSGLYAAGSFGGSVSLYQEDHDGSVGHLDGVKPGGITQLQFHPLSPNHLFISSRRSNVIQVYDVRNPSASSYELQRPGDTNQRLLFDLDPWGRYMGAGDEYGLVTAWDIASMAGGVDSPPTQLMSRKLGQDAIGSVQFHPFKPLLLSTSGSRWTAPLVHEDSSSDTDTGSTSDVDSDDQESEEFPWSARHYGDKVAGSDIRAGEKEEALRVWSFA